jgi:SAM-dependent methyltransferase
MTTDRETLLARIRKEQWYQSIPLGDGTSTAGETGASERDKIAMMDLPADLSGKSVLDIGCSEGFYSFEFESRGAARILAIDNHPDACRKAGLLHQLRASKVEFRKTDFFQLDSAEIGRHDIVLFLSVFHHLRHPLLAIDRLFDLTEEVTFIEYVEAMPESAEEISLLLRRRSKKAGRYQMLPTRSYMLELLDRAGYSQIDVLGTHRREQLKEKHGTPGFHQQRVLLKATR